MAPACVERPLRHRRAARRRRRVPDRRVPGLPGRILTLLARLVPIEIRTDFSVMCSGGGSALAVAVVLRTRDGDEHELTR
jgi:hypothetical protein